MDFEDFERMLDNDSGGDVEHFSFSQVSQFLMCPQRWYRSYILGIKSPPNMNLTYGKAVHRTVERVNLAWRDARKSGKDLPLMLDTGEKNIPWEEVFVPDFSQGFLKDAIESDELYAHVGPLFEGVERAEANKFIASALIDDEFDLQGARVEFVSVPTLKDTIGMGKEHIKEYVRNIRNTRKWFPLEVEHYIRVHEEELGVDLVGVIDLIETNKDGKKRIKDFKTSARSYGENKSPATSLQLQAYSLMTGIRDVAWEVFVKTKKPKLQTCRTDTFLETVYSDRELALASGKLKMIMTEMKSLKDAYRDSPDASMFIPCNPYDNWVCTRKWCDYYDQCGADCARFALKLKQ